MILYLCSNHLTYLRTFLTHLNVVDVDFCRRESQMSRKPISCRCYILVRDDVKPSALFESTTELDDVIHNAYGYGRVCKRFGDKTFGRKTFGRHMWDVWEKT